MKERAGPLFVAIAAILWATDAIFRFPTADKLDPTFIVFVEHLIAVSLLAVPMLIMKKGELFSLKPSEWAASAFVGIGGSALATVFFTASFKFINPSVSILLQKLQPILVTLIAMLFLRERPAKNFFLWAPVALASAIVLSFPDLDFAFLSGDGLDLRSTGVVYCLSAAGIWAMATVVGKFLLTRVPAAVATFHRFLFGLIALGVLVLLTGSGVGLDQVMQPEILKPLAYMGLVPGLLAMLFYYAGLERTPASVVTFVELLFPVSAVLLNWKYLNQPLVPVQLFAGAILLISVTLISTSSSK